MLAFGKQIVHILTISIKSIQIIFRLYTKYIIIVDEHYTDFIVSEYFSILTEYLICSDCIKAIYWPYSDSMMNTYYVWRKYILTEKYPYIGPHWQQLKYAWL